MDNRRLKLVVIRGLCMNKSILFSIFIIALCAPCFAQYGNETITITTYYPSPHGVYGVLTLYPRDSQPDLETTREGDLYYDKGTEDPTNRSKGVYVYNGSNWTLTNLGGGASSGDALVNAAHSKLECTQAGGRVEDTEGAFKQCRFGDEINKFSECPSGWKPYLDWSVTERTCVDPPSGCSGGKTCLSFRDWANSPPGTAEYCKPPNPPGGYCSCGHTLHARIVQIGCY